MRRAESGPFSEVTEQIINGVSTPNENNDESNSNPSDNRNQNNSNIILNTSRGELLGTLAQYDGTDPTRILKLPKLRTNKNTNNIIKSYNIIL